MIDVERRISYDDRLERIEKRLDSLERLVNRGIGGLGVLVIVVDVVLWLAGAGHLR